MLLAYFHPQHFFNNKKDDSRTNSTVAEYDGPDLAAQQEFERTKDPALGYVPRERLYQAYLYAEKLRQAQANKQAPTNNNKP